MKNDDGFNPFPEPFEIELTDTLDLHSFAPKNVRSVTEEFIKEAHRKGFEFVRVIHGKGIGVQREIVRSVVSGLSFVESFSDADEFSGGGKGATVVKLFKNQ
ncbi:MAG: Smr/MutS family protein [Pyrinomonadaceae bacterium]